jgi:hypothetical protein
MFIEEVKRRQFYMTYAYFQHQKSIVDSFPHYTLQNLQVLEYILRKQIGCRDSQSPLYLLISCCTCKILGLNSLSKRYHYHIQAEIEVGN